MDCPQARPTMDDLLAHQGWLRKLARTLAVDELGADDLLQETWLAALRRPPKRAGNLRAWLAQTMRNRAVSSYRADSRRRRREELTQGGVLGQGGVEEAVERGLMQSRVAEAVLRLSPQDQQVIILRYLEDLAPRVVADRLGEPVATVRKRILRARRRLRSLLDQHYGEGWPARCLALFPLRFPAPYSLLLSKPAKISIGISLLAIITVLISRSPEPPRVDHHAVVEGATPGLASPERRNEARIALDSAEAGPGSAVSEPTAELTRNVPGLVCDSLGIPVEGAAVSCPEFGLSVTTDAQGGFVLPVPNRVETPPGRCVELAVWAEGWQMTWAIRVLAEDRMVITLVPAEPDVACQIRDAATGAPVAGAVAELWLRRGFGLGEGLMAGSSRKALGIEIGPSSSDGILALPVTGEGFDRRITAPGYQTAWVTWSQQRAPEQVALHPEAPLRVQVLGPGRDPLEGADVLGSAGPLGRKSDADGWLSLPGLWRDECDLAIRSGERTWLAPSTSPNGCGFSDGQRVDFGFFPRSGEVNVANDGDPGELEVATFPIRNWVQLGSTTTEEEWELLAWCPVSEDGGFRIDRGWQGSRTALAVREVGRRQILLVGELQGPGPYLVSLPSQVPATLRFHATPEASLEGAKLRILPDRGSAPLTVAGGRNPFWVEPRWIPVEGGEWRGAVPEGDFGVALRLRDGGVLTWHGVQAPVGGLEAVLDLGRLRQVEGVVQAAGIPLPACEVIASADLPDGPQYSWASRTDSEGSWVASYVPDVEATLEVFPVSRRLRPVRRPPWILGAEDTESHIDLPAGRLEVRVDHPSRIQRVGIRFRRKDLPERGGGRSTGFSVPVQALHTGQFSLLVSPGQYSVASDEPFVTMDSDWVVLRERQSQLLQVRVEEAGEIQLQMAEGQERFRGAVFFRREGEEAIAIGDFPGAAFPQDGGAAFRCRKLAPGSWTLFVPSQTERPDPDGPLVAKEGAPTLLELPLQIFSGHRTLVEFSQATDGAWSARSWIQDEPPRPR